ncbi:hypothetical protein LCGC14_2714640 [marine sediment metagenome]|uniref:Mannose-6-phosphate isomerase type II C-terminal domain-containing protein n=1 Tax=marine sediment metagenome TaxID=412755 RepID=A0A0F8ZZJ6_9ZZZZ
MRITEEGIKGSFKNIIVDRPWGYFGLYSDNEICTTKILYLKQGQSLSRQLHIKRSQFYLLLDGEFTLEYSDSQVPINKVGNIVMTKTELHNWYLKHNVMSDGFTGDMFGFEKRTVHRITYIGKKEYGRVLDLAFGENDENDIIRLDDEYGR